MRYCPVPAHIQSCLKWYPIPLPQSIEDSLVRIALHWPSNMLSYMLLQCRTLANNLPDQMAKNRYACHLLFLLQHMIRVVLRLKSVYGLPGPYLACRQAFETVFQNCLQDELFNHVYEIRKSYITSLVLCLST